jgi:two-component system, chemotaxis family, protein-glutamate methylesterase/glutaminase
MEKDGWRYEAIVVGTSAGGFHALTVLLGSLAPDYPIPIIIVQHRAKGSQNLLEEVFQRKCRIAIKQADEKEKIRAGMVYVAAPDYHLLVESDKTFSLSSDEPVHFSRPSIDVLFESAAFALKEKVVGIVLTGANNDGAQGISRMGGLTIAQDPQEAQYEMMPQAAIETKRVRFVWRLEEIRKFIEGLA